MKNSHVEDMEARENRVTTNLLQKSYLVFCWVCAILAGLSLRQWSFVVSNKILVPLFVVFVLCAIGMQIYNHKTEHHNANKVSCNLFTLSALCMFLVHFVPYVV
ncbi:uncharacterized protein YacL [Clostridiales Family XIII bacterium PM5-7]